MEGIYQKQIDFFKAELKKKQSWFNKVGYGKLILIIGFIVSLYQLYIHGFLAPYTIFAGLLFAVTAVVWIYHIRMDEQVNFYREMIRINQLYLDRIEGKWTEFEDQGNEFLEKEHPYAVDLNVVGPESLFQMLNVTHTWHGRKTFSSDLLNANYAKKEVEKRQQGVSELSKKVEFSNIFQYHTNKIHNEPAVVEMVDYLKKEDESFTSEGYKALLWFPLAVTLFCIISVIFKLQYLYLPCGALLLLNAGIWIKSALKINSMFSFAPALSHTFQHYAAVLAVIGKEDFETAILCEMKETLSGGDGSASEAMKELDSIISKINIRNSGILYFLLNLFLLWDIRCAINLGKWKKKYGAACENWFWTLGSLESLLSLSVLGNVCSFTCIPEIADDLSTLEVDDLGHPLIQNEKRVSNPISIRDELVIISGSNMSGKTTFLRTAGINIILAKSGGFACASSMKCSLFYVMSSMQIVDNLNEGNSTFYVELQRIKEIIFAARKRNDLFFLIDELFRGTNSEDRLYGAYKVIKELDTLHTAGIVTTHDLSLCDLEKESDHIRNYSFSEQYKGDEMIFDYRIKTGKAMTTNAKYLMKKVGLLTDE